MNWLNDLAAMVSMPSLSDLAETVGILGAVGAFIWFLYGQWAVRQRDAKLEKIIQRRVDRLKDIFATKNQPHDAFLATKVLAADLGCTEAEVDEAALRLKTIIVPCNNLQEQRGYRKIFE